MELNEYNILPRDGEVFYFRNFFHEEECHLLYGALLEKIHWQQKQVMMYGRLLNVPRLTAWYGDEGQEYTYSGLKNKPLQWIAELLEIKTRLEIAAQIKFNSVLLNLYRNGNDSVDWHKDDEPEFGSDPVIGSVSFGGTRKFKFKHDQLKTLKTEIELTNGSFLLMKGSAQHHWYHSIPKTMKPVKPRINLTFRVIK